MNHSLKNQQVALQYFLVLHETQQNGDNPNNIEEKISNIENRLETEQKQVQDLQGKVKDIIAKQQKLLKASQNDDKASKTDDEASEKGDNEDSQADDEDSNTSKERDASLWVTQLKDKVIFEIMCDTTTKLNISEQKLLMMMTIAVNLLMLSIITVI